MLNQFSRTELLFGPDAMERLKNARVAVFGIGGVGGYVVEALARSGVGTLDLIDDDRVCLTNINRQIIATRPSIGKYKVEVARDRVKDINPKATVNIYKTFFLKETADQFDWEAYDYVVDAIDTVSGKIELVMQCRAKNIPIICSMGAGNKGAEEARRDPSQVRLLHRAGPPAAGGSGKQLQVQLHLPPWHSAQVHRPSRRPRQQRLCPLRCGAHHWRRGH